MSITDELRKAFDDCTVLAGVANTFECVYITKAAAMAMLEEVEAENAKLRELVRDMWHDGMCECDERGACAECEYHYTDRMRELGVNV